MVNVNNTFCTSRVRVGTFYLRTKCKLLKPKLVFFLNLIQLGPCIKNLIWFSKCNFTRNLTQFLV